MHADDLILVSVDDHICEPADMFDAHVPERYREYAPRVVEEADGSQQWYYGDVRGRNLGLNAVAGKPPEMFNVSPTRYEDMRPGCYRVDERVRDMSAGGQIAGLNFPNWTGFAGQVLQLGPDPEINLVMIRAYNDWHIDEWCGAHPDRFIPCGILPLFDVEASAVEIRRLAHKGCHAVTFSENPVGLGMPSMHTDAWDPLYAACCDTATVLCCHIGSSSKRASTTPGAPPPVPMNLSSAMAIYTLGDLLWADFWHRFPDLRFSLSEGDIGWIPYFLARAEHTLDRHNGWMRQDLPQGLRPTELFRERIICCFINDRIGMKLLDEFNIENLCWESDYPHSDSFWPRAPENLEELMTGVDDAAVSKITHENAMRHFQFDPFATRAREQCTVAALRAEVGDVDTVTRVGRPADETDIAAWKKMTDAAAKTSR
jgi:predicted TIM-barrel fold metal-dependent hydrolase